MHATPIKTIYTYTTSPLGMVMGGYNHSLEAFQALAAIAIEAFPALTPALVQCGVITKSDRYQGRAIVFFTIPDGSAYPTGWTLSNNPDFSF